AGHAEEHAETFFSTGDQLPTCGRTVMQQPEQCGCGSVQIRHTPSVPRSTLTCPLWPWDTATRRVPLGTGRKLPGESAGSARWGPPFSVSSPTSPASARDRTRVPQVLIGTAHPAAEILDTAIAKK